jgi:hypothetical protein
VLTAVHISPIRPGISLVEKKDRKNAAAATSGARPTLGESAAARPSRTPNPPMVMEIGRAGEERGQDRQNAPTAEVVVEIGANPLGAVGERRHPRDDRSRRRVTVEQQKSDLPNVRIAADSRLGGCCQIGMKMRGKEFQKP